MNCVFLLEKQSPTKSEITQSKPSDGHCRELELKGANVNLASLAVLARDTGPKAKKKSKPIPGLLLYVLLRLHRRCFKRFSTKKCEVLSRQMSTGTVTY